MKTNFEHLIYTALVCSRSKEQQKQKQRSEPNKTRKTLAISKFSSSAIFLVFILIFQMNLANLVLCNKTVESERQSTGKYEYANESLYSIIPEICEEPPNFVWSQLLEDYVVGQSSSSRSSKDLPFMSSVSAPNGYGGNGPMINNNQAPINYHSSAYKRPGVFITKRIGEREPVVELEPHMRPPIVSPQFRPMTNQMINQEQRQTPGFLQQLFGLGGGGSGIQSQQQQHHSIPSQQHRPILPMQQQPQQQQQQQHHLPPSNNGAPFRAVSENDLYLLGAIEKMVYRVDYLESRIRRAEQLIYYLMAGNNQKEVGKDPCPGNFTRISDNCYHVNSGQQVNWKTANTACKSLGAHLAEFEKVSENEEIMAYLLNQKQHRGHDFWVGGLNPGLLWIWSNSAKPVNPGNMNLTLIAMLNGNSTATNLIDHKQENDEKNENSDEETTSNETILNNTVEIKGQGRCLRLTYNEAKNSYLYYGQECTSRHHYICEYEDKTLDNKIKKITRDLKFD